MTNNPVSENAARGRAVFHAPLLTGADTLLASGLWLLFYLCLRFFRPLSEGGFAEAGFLYALAAAGVLYQHAKGRTLSRMSRWILGYELALASSCIFFRNSDLAAVQILALAAGAVLFLESLSVGSLPLLYERPLQVLVRRPLRLTAAGLPLFFQTFRLHRQKEGADTQHSAGFLLGIPLFLVCFALLSSGDSRFGSAVRGFQYFLNEEEFWNILMSLLAAVLAYGFSAMAADSKPDDLPTRSCSWAFFEPSFFLCIGLYAVYLMISVSGLAAFRAAAGTASVISGYAREGFFQLCAVAAINFGLILAANSASSSRPQRLRLLQKILSIETLGILALSAGRMILYVNAYGWTLRRFNVFAFLILLAGVLVLFLLDRCSPQRYVRAVMAAGAVMLLALSWCNEGALVTRFNLALCQENRIAADASIFGSAASAGAARNTSADSGVRLAAQSYLDSHSPVHEYRWNSCLEELPLNR